MNHHPLRSLMAVVLMAASAQAFADGRDRDRDRDDDIGCASGPLNNAARTDDDHSLKESLRVAGLTADGQLVCFKDKKPGKAKTIGTLSGYTGSDNRLIGIDFRPQDGLLYGVGNAGGLYVVNTASAVLTTVGQLSVLPDAAATGFGVDFNPAANALRIVASTGQNLRQSFANLGTATPLAATATDGVLGYTLTATPGPTAPGVVGAAYTNNDLAAVTGTTLLVLDSNLNQISLQSPANAGFLVATGQLGVNPSDGGLDIYSVLRNNVTVAQRALAALVVDGSAGLYNVDLLTGAASKRGSFNTQVIDIAIPLNQF